MRPFLMAAAFVAVAPALAFAQAAAPAGSTPAQQTMVVDWARYSTACRGGAVDGAQDVGLGYCGAASYLLYRLSVEGICLDTTTASFFSRCAPGSIPDPLDGYPF
ncbi:hypothetical protein [Paracoccus sp. Ld10]|uniref:hypothetical protein n=1 Tax=Paracoccus sp. Ld10 TaxID=649158 RepID=UPI0038681CDD